LKETQKQRGFFKGEVTFEERQERIKKEKERTRCGACGHIGHWAGDAVCPKKGKTGEKKFGKGKAKPKAKKGSGKSIYTLDGDDDDDEVMVGASANFVFENHSSEDGIFDSEDGIFDDDPVDDEPVTMKSEKDSDSESPCTASPGPLPPPAPADPKLRQSNKRFKPPPSTTSLPNANSIPTSRLDLDGWTVDELRLLPPNCWRGLRSFSSLSSGWANCQRSSASQRGCC
jgi:hypothetical protein